MVNTLVTAGIGTALLLALSWLASFIGFKLLSRGAGATPVTAPPEVLARAVAAQNRAIAWTKGVGNLTGILLLLGFVITALKLFADLVGG
jgi:hypothetical protein